MNHQQKHSSHKYLIKIFWVSITLVLLVLVNVWNTEKQVFVTLPNYNFHKTNSNTEKEFASVEEKLTRALTNAAENRKVILFWNPKNDSVKAIDKILGWRCGSCEITSNANRIQDANTGAVVVLYKWATPKLMPNIYKRRKDQLYVWLTGESPSNLIYCRHMSFFFEDMFKFNATMSYRRDADIYQPYFQFKLKQIETNLTKLMAQKNRFSVALVSNCIALPGSRVRLKYLRLLQSKIPVDGFGNCFRPTLAKSKNKTSLLQMLQKYKFYFAFENSYHCRDYITEKFFLNGIRGNTLPVVMGSPRKDYEARVPPESFIHVEDFPSMNKLVEYLNYLNNNDTAYLEHFKWRTRPEVSNSVSSNYQTGYCQLCRIINGINVDDASDPQYNSITPPRPLFTPTVSHRTVHSLSKWIKKESRECLARKYIISKLGTIKPV